MYDYSGSSFRAAVPRKKPLHLKMSGEESAPTYSLICCFHTQAKAFWLQLVQDFSTAFLECPPSATGLTEPLHGSTFFKLQPNFLKDPVVAKAKELRTSILPHIDRPFHVNERHPKQERRNKSNTFITIQPKRSEHDKTPPVVRRRAVEKHPPNPYEAWVTTTLFDKGKNMVADLD